MKTSKEWRPDTPSQTGFYDWILIDSNKSWSMAIACNSWLNVHFILLTRRLEHTRSLDDSRTHWLSENSQQCSTMEPRVDYDNALKKALRAASSLSPWADCPPLRQFLFPAPQTLNAKYTGKQGRTATKQCLSKNRAPSRFMCMVLSKRRPINGKTRVSPNRDFVRIREKHVALPRIYSLWIYETSKRFLKDISPHISWTLISCRCCRVSWFLQPYKPPDAWHGQMSGFRLPLQKRSPSITTCSWLNANAEWCFNLTLRVGGFNTRIPAVGIWSLWVGTYPASLVSKCRRAGFVYYAKWYCNAMI